MKGLAEVIVDEVRFLSALVPSTMKFGLAWAGVAFLLLWWLL